MDEIAGAASTFETQRPIEALQRENLVLKAMVVKLNRRLLDETQRGADTLQEMHLLRQANERLVLAAFDADDARMAAEAAMRRQTIFLSMLAHELRNPMASIAVANTVMASLGIDHPRMAKLLGIVERQGCHLVRMVDDLLDASRIATGKISLHTGMVKLDELIGAALDIAQPALTARQQTVDVGLPPGPLTFKGDAVRLAQLFSNLLLNAAKFSGPGQKITVAATVQDACLSVNVRDHGKGIAHEDQPHIFDLYAQGRDERAHAWSGGLGIGLTLVRAIAELHGGSVRVHSDGAGCGSQFTVQLPLCGPAAP